MIEQTRGLDFGPGFYLTTNEEQAIRFSNIIVNRRGNGSAIVNIYEFDMAFAENTLVVRRFGSADVEWLEFVVQNRLKTYQKEIYDIIIGAVANDMVMPTIQAFIGGFINVEAALITLKTSNLVDQVCLKTERALSLLRFVRAYETKGA